MLTECADESEVTEAYWIQEGDDKNLIPYRSYHDRALTQEQKYKNRLRSRMISICKKG